MQKKRIAILASGSGSNAEKIIEYFKNHTSIEVVLILSNKPDAYVLERAKKNGITHGVFNTEDFSKSEKVLDDLKKHQIDYLVLAGFLWLIPKHFVTAFPNKIINIHPSLLPKYGGKGMFGNHVHQAVLDHHESESGITIHLVNENYDEGAILFQTTFKIDPSDDVAKVGEKCHALEHQYFPQIIEKTILESENNLF